MGGGKRGAGRDVYFDGSLPLKVKERRKEGGQMKAFSDCSVVLRRVQQDSKGTKPQSSSKGPSM